MNLFRKKEQRKQEFIESKKIIKTVEITNDTSSQINVNENKSIYKNLKFTSLPRLFRVHNVNHNQPDPIALKSENSIADNKETIQSTSTNNLKQENEKLFSLRSNLKNKSKLVKEASFKLRDKHLFVIVPEKTESGTKLIKSKILRSQTDYQIPSNELLPVRNSTSAYRESAKGLFLEKVISINHEAKFQKTIEPQIKQKPKDIDASSNFIHKMDSQDLFFTKDLIKTFGDYLMGGLIGRGSFAKVKEGLNIDSLQRVAIKIISKRRMKRMISNVKRYICIIN
jgi:hypothetical protein